MHVKWCFDASRYFNVLTMLTSYVCNVFLSINPLCIWCVAALMSAAIFGNVSSIMLRLYQGTEEYHEMQTSIKEFINFHHIPKPLATRLIESHQHNWSYTNGIDMNSVSIKSVASETAGPIAYSVRLWLKTRSYWVRNPARSDVCHRGCA